MSTARPARAPESGFTLVEALVAMAVLAVGAVSLLGATEGHSARIGDVIDRTAARWAAETRLAELRLGLVPEAGPVESYGRSWTVSSTTEPTEDPALLRVTVSVAPEGADGALVSLLGYVAAAEES